MDDNDAHLAPQSQPWSRTSLGYFLLLLVVTLWTGSSFITNALFTDLQYNKPFLTTYLCTATFTIYLVPFAFRRWRKRSDIPAQADKDAPRRTRGAYQPLLDRTTSQNSDTADLVRRVSRRSSSVERTAVDLAPPLTTLETSKLALAFCAIWFAANVTINAALAHTTVSSVTILSSLSGLFTLGLGALFGIERFNLTRLLAVLASIIGVVLVSKADNGITHVQEGNMGGISPPSPADVVAAVNNFAPKYPFLGDALSVASAALYAVYTLLLKAKTGDETRISMTQFFGFVGAWNTLFFWPILVVLHLTGVERLEWPKQSEILLLLVINAFITFASDMLMMTSMLMTSPLAVTLGLSLTIPLAVFGDLFLGTTVGGVWFFVGAGLVLGGFIAVGVADATQRAEDNAEYLPSIETRTSLDEPLVIDEDALSR